MLAKDAVPTRLLNKITTLYAWVVYFLSDFIRKIIYTIVRLTPKTNKVVLRGFPSYEDNLIAIYQELLTRQIKSIVWVVDNPKAKAPFDLHEAVRLVKRNSLLDLYFSITSRYLFITHGHFLRATVPNQVCINLWHGIPFKAIGRTLGLEGRSDTMVVATSNYTRRVFAHAFDIPESKIIVTGQARTDRMFSFSREEIWERAFPCTPQPTKIYLWLPTFRRTSLIKGLKDGKVFDNIFNCSDFSTDEFNEYLSAHDAICFVKPHPMAQGHVQAFQSNIHFIDEEWLNTRQLSLYELTSAADCLISDISSIIADYMLLDRPMIILFEDIEEYSNSRGFSFDPITDYLPAEVTCKFRGFMEELKAVQNGLDVYRERRNILKSLFFAYHDGEASKRILDLVFEKYPQTSKC